jgi:perosamine synthetase
MYKNNTFFWRFRGNEKKYLINILKKGVKLKKHSYNLLLEKKWSKYHKRKYSITTNSCTSALHSAFCAIGLKKNDEVLVPALTPVMCANVIIFADGTPIFIDTKKDTFLMDPHDVEKKITKNTKAILLVHMYGAINNYKIFKKIAKKHKLKIIEDCAEALGAKDENKRLVGTMGDISCWSFQGAKHITCGDGGIMSTSNRKLAQRARKYSNLGFKFLKADADKIQLNKTKLQNPDTERFDQLGYNYRMNEFSAAIVLAQFERINYFLNLRRKLSLKFSEILKNSKILIPQYIPNKAYSTYYTFSTRLIDKKIKWKEFRDKFMSYGGDGIYAASKLLQQEPSIKNSNLGRCFKNCKKNCIKRCNGTPVATALQKEIFNFTTNQNSDAEVKKQTLALKKTLLFFNQKLTN